MWDQQLSAAHAAQQHQFAAAAAAAARAKAYSSPPSQPFLDAQFDIFEWHVHFQSCVRYFLDHAQYDGPVQALAAFINIRLPFQKIPNILSSRPAGSPPPPLGGASGRGAGSASSSGRGGPAGGGHHLGGGPLPPQHPPHVTLIPYIRRLVATGFDYPAVLHGFFGDDWISGIGPLHEQERRNYLFAAKSDTWLTVKAAYDMGEEQAIPFLRPLQTVTEKEIVGAEVSWSEWLAMQDWMLGPRDPQQAGGGGGGGAPAGGQHGGGQYGGNTGRSVRIKHEED